MALFTAKVWFTVYIPDVADNQEADLAMNEFIDKIGAVNTGELSWDDVDWTLTDETEQEKEQ